MPEAHHHNKMITPLDKSEPHADKSHSITAQSQSPLRQQAPSARSISLRDTALDLQSMKTCQPCEQYEKPTHASIYDMFIPTMTHDTSTTKVPMTCDNPRMTETEAILPPLEDNLPTSAALQVRDKKYELLALYLHIKFGHQNLEYIQKTRQLGQIKGLPKNIANYEEIVHYTKF